MGRKLDNRTFLRFNDRWFRILGIPLAGSVVNFLIMGPEADISQTAYLYILFSSVFYTFIYWEFNRFQMIALRRRFPEVGDTIKRLLISALIVLTFVGLVTLCSFLFMDRLIGSLFQFNEAHPPYFRIFVVSLLFNVLFLGVYEAIYSAVGWNETRLQSEELKRASLQSQLDNLKSRVNPHFLFNSLNTLSALIHERPDDAVRAVEQLARSYRYLLQATEKEVVSVREELENVRAYLYLLQIRFGEALETEIEVPEQLQDRFIVPLALQMLVENAIKHNVLRQKQPLKIRIFTGGDAWLSVENPIHPRPQPPEGTGTGLANIRHRYALTGGQKIRVHQGNAVFRVDIPLLKIHAYARPDH